MSYENNEPNKVNDMEKTADMADPNAIVTFLKKQLNKLFKGDREPGEPKISFVVFYSPHNTAKDFEKLGDLLPEADVYIPESPGAVKSNLFLYEKVSNGKLTPKEAIKMMQDVYGQQDGPLYVIIEEEFKQLHNKNKHIFIADDPNFDLPSGKIDLLLDNFEKELAQVKKSMKKFAEVQKIREDFMLNQLNEPLKKFITSRTDLKNKKEVKVLLQLGSFHTRVFLKLREKNSARREFSTYPYVYSFYSETRRAHVFGKEVDDDLAAKAYFDLVVTKFFKKDFESISDDTAKIGLLKRNIIEQFNYDEIKQLHDLLKESTNYPKTVINFLSTKNITLPRDEKGMDAMIDEWKERHKVKLKPPESHSGDHSAYDSV